MKDVKELSSQDPDVDGYVEQTGLIIFNYNKVDGIQSKRGGVKNITCTFCYAAFTGCSQAFAHILGKAVIRPKQSNIGAFVPNVKVVIIIVHSSKMLREFSTKKGWPRDNCSVLHNQSNIF